MTNQTLSDEDVKNRCMPSDVTERIDSALSLDLSVPPCGMNSQPRHRHIFLSFSFRVRALVLFLALMRFF